MTIQSRSMAWKGSVFPAAVMSATLVTASAASADPILEMSGLTRGCFGDGCTISI